MQKAIAFVGMDLGTFKTSVASSAGIRDVLYSAVGWPRDHVARTMLGWSGKRTAWLSAVGFVVILVNLLPVAYLVPTSHAFE